MGNFQFLWNFVDRECFTIENFPQSYIKYSVKAIESGAAGEALASPVFRPSYSCW